MHEHRCPPERCDAENNPGPQLEIANDLPEKKRSVRKVEERPRDDSRTVPRMRDGADEVQDAVCEHEKPDPRSQNEAGDRIGRGRDEKGYGNGDDQSYGVDRKEATLADAARNEAVEPHDETGSLLEDVENEDEGREQDELP